MPEVWCRRRTINRWKAKRTGNECCDAGTTKRCEARTDDTKSVDLLYETLVSLESWCKWIALKIKQLRGMSSFQESNSKKGGFQNERTHRHDLTIELTLCNVKGMKAKQRTIEIEKRGSRKRIIKMFVGNPLGNTTDRFRCSCWAVGRNRNFYYFLCGARSDR